MIGPPSFDFETKEYPLFLFLFVHSLFVNMQALNLNYFYYNIGKCATYEFTCSNGKCISRWRRCNWKNDCGDNSDEWHCRKFIISLSLFSCYVVVLSSRLITNCYWRRAVVTNSRYKYKKIKKTEPSLPLSPFLFCFVSLFPNNQLIDNNNNNTKRMRKVKVVSNVVAIDFIGCFSLATI